MILRFTISALSRGSFYDEELRLNLEKRKNILSLRMKGREECECNRIDDYNRHDSERAAAYRPRSIVRGLREAELYGRRVR
jgi:hypothetical protein